MQNRERTRGPFPNLRVQVLHDCTSGQSWRCRGWQRRQRLLLITLPGGGSSPAHDSCTSFTTYDNIYHTFSPYGLDDAAIKLLPSVQFLSASRALLVFTYGRSEERRVGKEGLL